MSIIGILQDCSILLSIISIGLVIILNWRNLKKTNPTEIRLEELEKWKNEVQYKIQKIDIDEIAEQQKNFDKLIENDNKRLKELEKDMHDLRLGMKLLLSSNMQILSHLSDGNHSGELKDTANKINQFLIENL